MLNILKARRDLAVTVIGRAVSSFGDGVALVALVLRLQEHGARPYEVGLLLGAGGLPQLLLAGPVGRLVDRHDSRQLLVWGGLAEIATTIPLIFLHSVVAVMILVAVLGAATSLTGTTWSALLPRVAGEDHVAEAVSAQQSLNVLVLVAAPAVGGLLAGAFGAGVPIAVDAVTFVVVTAAGVLVHTRRAPATEPDGSETEKATGGFAILRADRILGPLLGGVGLVVLLVGMVDVVLVFLVRDTLGASAAWYGIAEATWMAGMVAGSVGAGRVKAERTQVQATIAGAALVCAALAGFAVAPTVGVLIPLSILGGIGNGYAGTCLSTLLMTRTADQARGRVSAAATVVLGGSQGASILLGSLVALALSPRAIYAIGGLLGLAAAGLVALTTWRGADSPGPAGLGTPPETLRPH